LNPFLACLFAFKYAFLLVMGYLIFTALGNVLRAYRPAASSPRKRFLVLIPAHNEAGVIGDLLRNLFRLHYPRELYRVVVIADNCTDDTAAIARAEGAEVLARNTAGAGGKGRAMEWALRQLDGNHDAVAVFDADNRVHLDFLQKMNDGLCAGHRLLQGFLGTKNPNDNWLTRVLHLHQASINTLWHAGKHGIGLGNYLVGTGMVIDRGLLEKHGWNAVTLTEDLEFTLRMALVGEKVLWLRDAVVYDERPSDLRTAWRQQQRWLIGTWHCLSRYFWPVLLHSLRTFRLDLADLAFYLITPLWFILNMVYGLANAGNSIFRWVNFPPDPWMTALGSAFGVLYFYAGLKLAKEPALKNLPYVILYLLVFPLFGTAQVLWSLIKVRETRWYHTPHSARLDPKIEAAGD
jgi:cellulose synthase/poly-beta-1,6-N-acetylglucosamine synthase-like glycosyltransferase